MPKSAGHIEPDKITTPTKLVAAWLVCLNFLVLTYTWASMFHYVDNPQISLYYAYTAIGVMPVFVIAVFLLQTRYRPEMLEDIYYQQVLSMRWIREMNSKSVVYDEKKRRILS